MGHEKEDMILHIDCNTFYASCEASLRPDLFGKPIVVANCNEAGGGIILALNREAKALGLKRGDPVFKVQDILNYYGVAVFPANLPKYVDISRRLMQVVRDMDMVTNFQQYSVDEFFGELPLEDPQDLREAATRIKRQIERCTGIPVSCGISLSYTLGKVATWYAKHFKGYNGVCVLPKDKIEIALKDFEIGEVWGIGRSSALKLRSRGIDKAIDFYNKREFDVKHLLNINGVRTWQELHGIPTVDIETVESQKSMMHSSTFTYMAEDLNTLSTYVANYSAAVSRKLRDQHSACLCVSVFLGTNPHRDDLAQYGNMASVWLPVATADSIVIGNAAQQALNSIFRKGFKYKRAGVMLTELSPDNAIQLSLFCPNYDVTKSKNLMGVFDSVNNKFGMDTLRLASQGFEKPKLNLMNFQPMKNETTNINDIITVR